MKRLKLNTQLFADGGDSINAGEIVVSAVMRAEKFHQGTQQVEKDLDSMNNAAVNTNKRLETLSSNKGAALRQLRKEYGNVTDTIKKLEDIANRLIQNKGFAGGIGKLTTSGQGTIERLMLSWQNTKQQQTFGDGKGDINSTITDLTKSSKYISFLREALNNELKAESKLIDDNAQKELKAFQKRELQEQKEIQNKQKVINSLEKELKTYVSNEEKKAIIQQQKEQEAQVKIDFQQTYTDLGNEELTQKYREQYRALMDLLQPEQQDVVVKKLMEAENKRLINSTVSQIQALKEENLAGTQNVTVIDKIRMALNKMDASTAKVKNNFKSMINTLKSTAVTWRILSGVFSRIISMFANMYDKAASYEESINLYTVALGDYAQQGREWASRISDALYLDPKDVMQYTGAFYNLVQGLGVAKDAAYTMATNLTQLSYDMSSYLNIDVESAHDKLQSAITGQSRAIASAGVAMQVASLQQLAYNLGIKESVSNMSQAEKTYLRYIQIMRSTANMQGDLARTIITPENALRVIRTQFNLLSRAIGQVFIPIVLKVIPYIMLLVEALKKLANWLAKWTGYEIADVDYSSVKELDNYLEDVGVTAGDTSSKVGKAVKDIKDELGNLASFDELNVVTFNKDTTSASGVGGAGVGGGSLGKLKDLISGYDMLEGLTSKFNDQMDAARENVKKMIPIVKTVGLLFLGWKLTKMFMESIVFVDNFLKAWSTMKTLGVFAHLPSLSAILDVPFIANLPAAFSVIGETISGMASGTIALGNGLSLIASAAGEIAIAFAGIFAIIGGIMVTIKGIKKLINGDKLKGIITIIEGIAIVVAGVALLFGGWVVAAIAAVVAIVAAVIVHWDKVKAFFIDLWDNITNKVVEVTTNVMNTLEPIVDWLKTNIIDPIWGVIEPVINNIMEAFESIWSTVKTVFTAIWDFVSNAFTNIFDFAKHVFSNIIEIVSGIVQPIWTIFKKVWEIVFSIVSDIYTIVKGVIEQIITVLTPIATWVWDNVLSPIVGFFTGMITKINENFIQPITKKLSELATIVQDTFHDIAVAVVDTIKDRLKTVLNGLFTLIENKINGFIDGLNRVKGYINKILPEKMELGTISHIDIPRFEEGGYPTSGDLFYANENGIPEYITSIGNKSAVVNQQQMVTALTNAIVEGLSNMNTPQSNEPVNIYIGNDKVYSGFINYAKRQNNIYGTNVIRV